MTRRSCESCTGSAGGKAFSERGAAVPTPPDSQVEPLSVFVGYPRPGRVGTVDPAVIPLMDLVVVDMFEKRSFDNPPGYPHKPGEVPSFGGVLGRNLSNPIPDYRLVALCLRSSP